MPTDEALLERPAHGPVAGREPAAADRDPPRMRRRPARAVVRRCSASPRAPPASRSVAWWSGASCAGADGVYELAGRVRARQRRAGLEPRPEAAAVGRDRGGSRSSVRGRARTPADRPRCATRCAAALRASCARACGRGPTISRARRRPTTSWAVVDAQCEWWSARPDDDAAALAAELFDVARWATRARPDARSRLDRGDERAWRWRPRARRRLRDRRGVRCARSRRSVAAGRARGRARRPGTALRAAYRDVRACVLRRPARRGSEPTPRLASVTSRDPEPSPE